MKNLKSKELLRYFLILATIVAAADSMRSLYLGEGAAPSVFAMILFGFLTYRYRSKGKITF